MTEVEILVAKKNYINSYMVIPALWKNGQIN